MGRRRRPGLGGGLAAGSSGTGGTSYDPSYQPSPKPQTSPDAPPYFTYDPEIEAQRRESERGLEDTEANTKTSLHYAQTDLHQALKGIHIKAHRGRQDINRSADRANQKLGNEQADTEKGAHRREQDFQTGLANIARQFGQLGHRQGEAANASGTYDRGTLTAGATARANNQGLAEAPIKTGMARNSEDLATALGRIGTARGEVAADQTRGLGRVGQDARLERGEKKRGFGREKFKGEREVQRAKREQAIKDTDLLAEEIYAARQEHPGVFKQWLKKHPAAMSAAKERATGQKPSGKGKNKSKNKGGR